MFTCLYKHIHLTCHFLHLNQILPFFWTYFLYNIFPAYPNLGNFPSKVTIHHIPSLYKSQIIAPIITTTIASSNVAPRCVQKINREIAELNSKKTSTL